MIFTMLLYLLRLPKTPAVRNPRHKERVYSISVNGSPIAAGNEDIIINVPIGNGEVSAQLAGSDFKTFKYHIVFYQQCQHQKTRLLYNHISIRSIFSLSSLCSICICFCSGLLCLFILQQLTTLWCRLL